MEYNMFNYMSPISIYVTLELLFTTLSVMIIIKKIGINNFKIFIDKLLKM